MNAPGTPASAAPTDPAERLQAAARRHFGWSSLRPDQLVPMTALLEGRDALVVMPTGSGKSAVYQVPALLLDGPTVVVSPLIALQHDQLVELAARADVDLSAAVLNSTAGGHERAEVLRRLAARELEFVFLAPEQFAHEDVLDAVRRARPGLFAVDEAHCVSSWGRDFRPEYLRLGSVITALGHPPVVALTATASPPVRAEIIDRLGLREPYSVTVAGFDRPEIELAVHAAGGDERSKTDAVIVEAVAAAKPALVYVATKAATTDYAGTLAETGLRTAAYHGGMADRVREDVHERWRSGDLDVVVATSAFGMGIDKADVRSVVHADPPESLDEYLQEVGRSGRDGRPARAVLVWRAEDLSLRRFFARGVPKETDAAHLAAVLSGADGTEQIDEIAAAAGFGRQKTLRLLDLLQYSGSVRAAEGGGFVAVAERPDPVAAGRAAVALAEQRERVEQSRVELVRAYAETAACRRQVLLASFGEVLPAPCGNCDTCASGSAARVEVSQADSPFPLETPVRHRDWGVGTVIRYDGEHIVVRFDGEGFKTLSIADVLRHDLLTTA